MFVNVHLQREYNPKQSFFVFLIVKLLTPIVNSNNLFY